MQNKFKTILSIFIFCARWRADVRMRACFWPEIDRTDIDLNHDKYEWEMPFRYEDMIMS